MDRSARMKQACLAAGCLLAALAGCVQPQGAEVDTLTRYQDALLAQSPQTRQGSTGLPLLTPVVKSTDVPLTVEKGAAGEPDGIMLSLDQAVYMAMLNNSDIRVVAFDPAISREQMTEAAAAFDFTVFGSIKRNKTNHDTTTPNEPLTNKTMPIEVGVKETNPLGTQTQLAWDLTWEKDTSIPLVSPALLSTFVNPHYESILAASVTQPLLKGFGPDYNLAQLHVAELREKSSYSQFRQKAEEIVDQVSQRYWRLVEARVNLDIQMDLLGITISTYDRLSKRQQLDVTAVELKQTEAALETRKADVVRAREAVYEARNNLVRLLDDKRLNSTNFVEVIPTTPAVASEFIVDPADQLVLALDNNPLMEQARLAIDAADIGVLVARNETLPTLNLVATSGLQALRKEMCQTIGQMYEAGKVDYGVGLTFEYPIGNRGPEAALRQRQFERLKSISQLQNTADEVARTVNEVVHQIKAAYAELKARQAAVDATEKQLLAIDALVEKGPLTPTLLQLQLNAQDSMAQSRQLELAARINFNTGVSALSRATGTTLSLHNVKVDADAIIRSQVPSLALPAGASRPASAPAPARTMGMQQN